MRKMKQYRDMRLKKSKIRLLISAFFISYCCFVNIAHAKLVTSVTDGDWTTTETWDNGEPVSGDEILILHDITISSNVNTPLFYIVIRGGSLDLSNNGKLTLASGSLIVIESGFIIGDGSNDQLKIGGTKVYSGSDADNPIGPTYLDEDTPSGEPYPTETPSSGHDPLPVELLYFSAQSTQNQVSLYWATVSELNNDFFTLEKSNNGIDFVKLAEVPGMGSTNLQTDYSFIDTSPYLGLSYYRLSQTDYDGTTEIFPVVSILIAGERGFSLVSNPVSGSIIKLNICEMGNNELLELNIVDLQGRLVEKKQIKTDGCGNADAVIQLKKPLEKGTYIFELASERKREYQKVAAN